MAHYNKPSGGGSSYHTMKGKGAASSPASTKAPKLTPRTRGTQSPTSGQTSAPGSGGAQKESGPKVWD